MSAPTATPAPTATFTPTDMPAEEVKHGRVLNNLLCDETFHDIKLEGSDGGKVGANRAVLAARSEVFKRTLFGGFSEAASTTVKLGYPAAVIKLLVDYIHTDIVDAVECLLTDKSLDESIVCIKTLLSLGDASVYYNFPELCTKIGIGFITAYRKDPSLAFVVLSCCDQEGPSIPICFSRIASSHARANAGALGENNSRAIQLLSYQTMLTILKDEKIDGEEINIFKLLQLWTGNGTDQEQWVLSGSSHEDRRACARQLAEHIRLELISVAELSTTVASSGLVPSERLALAYKAYALNAEKNHNIPHKKSRRNDEEDMAAALKILNGRSNKLTPEDRNRLCCFVRNGFNPTPDKLVYRMKSHQEKKPDVWSGKTITNNYYVELNYVRCTLRQLRKTKIK